MNGNAGICYPAFGQPWYRSRGSRWIRPPPSPGLVRDARNPLFDMPVIGGSRERKYGVAEAITAAVCRLCHYCVACHDITVRCTTSEVRANPLQRWRTWGGSAYRGTVRDHLPPGLPPDPFAGDPSDPSAALDAIEPGEPLDPHERLAVEEDLADLAVYEALLAHRGIRGLVVSCEDCRQDHYHDWDMLRANLLQLLVDGTVRPHEPAYDPTPEAYVTWDYCRGYADASMNEALHGDGFDGFDV